VQSAIALNSLDWAIVAVVGVSVLLGVLRGFVREVLSLAGWVVGIWLALRYASALGRQLPFDLPWAEARTAIAALAIVVGVLLVAGLIAWVLGKLLAAVKLSGTDRLLGAFFGLLRAALVVMLFTVFGGRTALAQQPLWRESLLIPLAEAAVRFASPLLPLSDAARSRT
jgi:membrane protein required for colicin V production